MLTAVRCVLSKLVSPLWRTVEVEGDIFSHESGKYNITSNHVKVKKKFGQLNRV